MHATARRLRRPARRPQRGLARSDVARDARVRRAHDRKTSTAPRDPDMCAPYARTLTQSAWAVSPEFGSGLVGRSTTGARPPTIGGGVRRGDDEQIFQAPLRT